MSSPTQRSLKFLRSAGWTAAVVERWNPYAKIRQDVFGFADLIAFRGPQTVLVQCTTASNMAARRAKIASIPAAADWRNPEVNRYVLLHGWKKSGPRGKRKTWHVTEEFI